MRTLVSFCSVNLDSRRGSSGYPTTIIRSPDPNVRGNKAVPAGEKHNTISVCGGSKVSFSRKRWRNVNSYRSTPINNSFSYYLSLEDRHELHAWTYQFYLTKAKLHFLMDDLAGSLTTLGHGATIAEHRGDYDVKVPTVLSLAHDRQRQLISH